MQNEYEITKSTSNMYTVENDTLVGSYTVNDESLTITHFSGDDNDEMRAALRNFLHAELEA